MKDIIRTYEIDIKNKSRALPKITPTHLIPNLFQNMSCKLTIQLLNYSVSALIKTCITTGELKSHTATNTAEFINKVDNVFHSANSKYLYDPKQTKDKLVDVTHKYWKIEIRLRKYFKMRSKYVTTQTNLVLLVYCGDLESICDL
jgi:hypothetical protein